MAVPSTDTTMFIDTRANVRTASASGSILVDIADNQGTVAFGGSGVVPAFIYRRVPFPENGYTLLSGMGVTDGAWLLFWLYCAPDGTLGGFFGERTDSPQTLKEVVSGTCNITLMDWNMPVHVPGITLRDISLACGFSVTTPPWDAPLYLQSAQPGTASIDGTSATALVFTTVDCRTGCGAGSWFELHSILSQPSSGQVAFAIWYLPGTSSGLGVSAQNGFLLPAAGWTDILHPNATWSLDR